MPLRGPAKAVKGMKIDGFAQKPAMGRPLPLLARCRGSFNLRLRHAKVTIHSYWIHGY